MLQCPICLRNGFQRLTRHFSQVHGLGRQEVLTAFPDLALEITPAPKEVKCSGCGVVVIGVSARAAYVKCEACRKSVPSTRAPGFRTRSAECREKQATAAKERWAKPEEREAQSARLKTSAPWKGKNLSPEHRAAISVGGRGVKHQMSAAGGEAIGTSGRKNLVVARSQPSYKAKLSEGATRRHANSVFGLRDPGTLAKAQASLIRNGVPKGAGRGISGFRKDLPHYTRSTLEANFARLLRLLGVPYEYEPKCFKLLDGQGHYTPDFHLALALMEGNRVVIPAGWVELKGWRTKEGGLPAGTQEKVDALRTLLPGEAVTVLVQSDDLWRRLEQKYAPLIDMWETPRRNLRTDISLFAP